MAAVIYSPIVERALRFAADRHRDHCRKNTKIPYFTHPTAVALMLARCGFDDDVLAAAFLHDVVEDAGVSAEEIAESFPQRIADLVLAASEQKSGPDGETLPWQFRKDEHLARLPFQSVEARAIVLADKLHNLGTVLDDAEVDRDVWNRFNAGLERQCWYYQAVYEAVGDEPALTDLRRSYAELLQRLQVKRSELCNNTPAD